MSDQDAKTKAHGAESLSTAGLGGFLLIPRSAYEWMTTNKPVICEKSGLDKAAPIPEGWQLVPKVPTEEMLLAGMGDDWPEDLYLRDVYELMLEAAPKTPNAAVTGGESKA